MTPNEFIDRHYGNVLRALRAFSGSDDEAEDATQDAFTKLLGAWARVSQMDNPAGWVYVVGVNRLRRRRRHASREDLLPHVAAAPIVEGASIERVDEVRRLLRSLSRRQQQAVILRFFADMTYDEIAQAMGCRPGTVKSTLNAAVQRLRPLAEADESSLARNRISLLPKYSKRGEDAVR